jgi:hypothetical protein
MVVMDPHIVIIWAYNLHHFVSKNLVHRNISLPKGSIETETTTTTSATIIATAITSMVLVVMEMVRSRRRTTERQQVMKQGPQGLLTKAMVEPCPHIWW